MFNMLLIFGLLCVLVYGTISFVASISKEERLKAFYFLAKCLGCATLVIVGLFIVVQIF